MDASAAKATSASPSGGAAPAQSTHKGNVWLLALTALGVVFGDIGTSPLYTFSVTLGAVGQTAPSAGDVLGIVSLIFWALMAMV